MRRSELRSIRSHRNWEDGCLNGRTEHLGSGEVDDEIELGRLPTGDVDPVYGEPGRAECFLAPLENPL
jgi:hypothetical protein